MVRTRRVSRKPRTPTRRKPDHIVDTMAFMFETRNVIRPTQQALESPHLQRDYFECWQGLKKHFHAPQG